MRKLLFQETDNGSSAIDYLVQFMFILNREITRKYFLRRSLFDLGFMDPKPLIFNRTILYIDDLFEMGNYYFRYCVITFYVKPRREIKMV